MCDEPSDEPSIEYLASDPAEGTGILLWVIVSCGLLAIGICLLIAYGC